MRESADSGSNEGDRKALAAVYEAAGGEAWGENWNTEADLRAWWGVTADVTGRVTGLNLMEAELKGSISRQIGNLSKLRELYLDITMLSGPIPPELGNLRQLQIFGLGGTRYGPNSR